MIFSKHGQAFCFLCRLIPMRPRGIHGVVQRGFKRYFKQTEKCTSFFANASRCRHFPISPPFFLKTQRHLYVVIIFEDWRIERIQFLERFLFCFISKILVTETCNSSVFPYMNIGHHTSSNTDRLEILLWRTKASGHTIVLPQENHR